MAILSKGNTFSDGDQVTSTKLNNLVDNATFVAGSGGTTDDATLEVNGSGRLQVKAIQTGNIASSAVTTAKIADDAVTTAKIADSNVTTAKIADDSVTNDKIADNAIQQAQMADNSVGTAEIIDANVTASKLDGAQTGSAPIYGVRAWVNFDGTSNADKSGTYSRTELSTTATITILSHGLSDDQYVYLDFASGTVDGIYQVTVTDENIFTITTAETSAQSSIVVTLKLVTVTASANINYVGRASTSAGRYLVGFTEDMPSANYAFFGSAEDNNDADLSDLLVGCPFNGTKTAKSIYITVANSGNSGVDSPAVSVAFIG